MFIYYLYVPRVKKHCWLKLFLIFGPLNPPSSLIIPLTSSVVYLSTPGAHTRINQLIITRHSPYIFTHLLIFKSHLSSFSLNFCFLPFSFSPSTTCPFSLASLPPGWVLEPHHWFVGWVSEPHHWFVGFSTGTFSFFFLIFTFSTKSYTINVRMHIRIRREVCTVTASLPSVS